MARETGKREGSHVDEELACEASRPRESEHEDLV